MPVYRLGPSPIFPPPEEAEEGGLLAVGGDLSPQRLLAAYAMGIFPWYQEAPILWYSPDPRTVLLPGELRVSRRLRRTLKQGLFELRFAYNEQELPEKVRQNMESYAVSDRGQ